MKFAIKCIAVFVLAFFFILSCQAKDSTTPKGGGKMSATVETLEIKSDAFSAGGMIPKKYTCDGDNISPQISWGKIPNATKELVLICDDPDAPMGTWVHWVLYGIGPSTNLLPENMAKKDSIGGITQGKNSFGKVGFGGPCPPHGSSHRYFFKLYALDKVLNLKPGAAKDVLTKAMEGHILAQGELMGRYGR
jgi:Raf kinase inhibitor-like YbhB/YbcL family protein